MRMRWLLISLLVASILTRYVPAQSDTRSPKTGRAQETRGSLPLETFRSKDVVAGVHRAALNVYSINKRERYIESLRVGDYFKEGERVFAFKEDLLKAIDESDKEKIKAYKNSLPMDGEYYVVEGDLLLTDEEIAGYLSLTSRIREFKYLQEGDPMLNVYDGEDDYYKALEKRNLTYAIDKQSFSAQQYEQVVGDMARAAKEWQSVCPGCGVTITRLEAGDAKPSHEGVNFIVRSHDAKGVYIASAFFPHDPPKRRYLNIDPLYFGLQSDGDRVGVLKHQLGHILGYRHVQPRDIAGCYYKDGAFSSLSRYAGNSVMRYFCSGDSNLALELTGSDVAFHRKTYEPPKLNTSDGEVIYAAPTVLVTRYEGGDVVGNIARILRELVRLKLVRVASYKVVGSDETVKTIYQSHLHLPIYSSALGDLANELSKAQLKEGTLDVGTEVFYPDVEFNQYEQTLKLDTDSDEDKAFEKDLRARNLIVRKSGKGPLALVTVRAYELRLALGSSEQLRVASDMLGTLISRGNINNVLVSSQESQEKLPQPRSLPNEPPPQYFTASSALAAAERTHTRSPDNSVPEAQPPAPAQQEGTPSNIQDVTGFLAALDGNGVEVGSEGGLRFLTDMPIVPPSSDVNRCKPQVNCPEILLIDEEVYPHPDLEGAYRRSYSKEDRSSVVPKFNEQFSSKEDGRQKIKLTANGPADDEHGTYMAGIIASRANRYGIVGLAPDAKIYSINWEVFAHNHPQLTRLLEERDNNGQHEGKQQIVVFATDWHLVNDSLPTENDSLPKEKEQAANKRLLRKEDRWTDQLASCIKNSTLLVVAAIGQPKGDETDKKPKEIDERFPDGPMNLGDLDNVITVTGCEDCYGPSPHIIGIANVPAEDAKNMVHVAAPAIDIPGTVKPFGEDLVRYAKGSGTSPATAIVAGVLYEMISYWPDSYRQLFNIKRRIQVTSRPTLLSEDASGLHLSVGILDPTIALRDPSKNWLKDSDSTWNDIGVFGWNEEQIPVMHPVTKKKSWINTEDILRIYRLDRYGKTYWVFYTKTDSRSLIDRQGPFLIDPNFQKEPLITLGSWEGVEDPSRGTKYSLEKINDLLLIDVNDKLVRYPSPSP
jgi:Subtilase family